MISKIEVKGFKPFRNRQALQLSPITVLCGVNSCGKTSLLQCLLLLKQTLADPSPNVILRLNGALLQLGTFANVVFGHEVADGLEIALELRDLSPLRRPRRGVFARSNWAISAARFEVRFNQAEHTRDVVVDYFSASLWPAGEHGTDSEPVSVAASRSGDHYDLSFDSLLVLENPYVVSLMSHMKDFDKLIRVRKPMRLQRVPVLFSGFFPVAFRLNMREITEQLGVQAKDLDGPEALTVGTIMSSLKEAVDRELESVSYIGPLRDEPQRHYVFDQGTTLEIGNKGEFAAHILALEGKHNAEYVSDVFHPTPIRSSLNEAVDYWICQRFQLTSRLWIKEVDDAIYQVMLETAGGGTDVSIPDVGFGVSQLLPLVVEGLRHRNGRLLVFEQPEIHLHPRMQAELADFLICLALAGRRVVVETHSDHLLTRLRRRVAEDPSNRIGELLSVYFAQQREGASEFSKIPVDQCGSAEMWPEGFFDQGDLDNRALLKAQFVKARAGRDESRT